MLGDLATTRYPARDRVMFLLSMKAGLRAKAMASLTWAMVTDAAGQVAEAMHGPNRASKGTTGGRTIPLHPNLQAALGRLQTRRGDMAPPSGAPLLGAGWGAVAGDRALVVSSALYLAQDGRLFVAFWSSDLHDPCRTQSLAGGWQSPGCPGTRRPYEARHDATLHRGRYGGQAQARCALVRQGRHGAPGGAAHPGPGPCYTYLC